MGAITSNLGPLPFMDPLSTMVASKLPKGLQPVVNPAGAVLKGAVGHDTAAKLLDPLSVGNLNPKGSQKQINAFLGSKQDEPIPQYPSTQPSLLG